MKNRLILSLLFTLLLFPSAKLFSQDDGNDEFKIVYVTTLDCLNDSWLKKVKEDWSATGISLMITWRDIESVNGQFNNWAYIDNAINKVKSYNLDVYLRIMFGFYHSSWSTGGRFSINDLHNDVTGDTVYDNGGFSLNFVSGTSKYYMFLMYNNLLQHLENNFSNDIIDIAPSITNHCELEYPHLKMTGYSNPEISAFRYYLISLYNNNISNLNSKWGSTFSSFNDINPRNFDWDNLAPYQYCKPSGRYDWINYRTSKLKEFIDTLASLTHNYGFKMNLHLGSIYDSNIEMRGWFDPTLLIENVDAVKVADIIEYKPNFDFGADYLRSISLFWNYMKNKDIKFTNETNWPGVFGHSAGLLTNDWIEQLEAFYYRGAKEHYIYGWYCWHNEDSINPWDLDSFLVSYDSWRQILSAYKNAPIQEVSYNERAVHLSCEQGHYEGNGAETNGIYKTFNFYKSIKAQAPYDTNSFNYEPYSHIITNGMINENPEYLNGYSHFSFTKSSKYIPDQTYLKLMQSNISNVPMGNATWYSDNGFKRFAYTQGIKNEYNELRSPIHLIWRSRDDLHDIWPDANLPAQGSGINFDFIAWAYLYGCGNNYNPVKPEYPEWIVFDNVYKYDKAIKKVWDVRTDLQYYYTDAHYRYNQPAPENIISWAKNYGYSEEPELIGNYNNWPYIGGDGDNLLLRIPNSSTNNTDFSLGNYPNPFNNSTKIKFNIPLNGSSDLYDVKLKLYDISGREIMNLFNNKVAGGNYEILFNATNLATGIYIYSLIIDNKKISKKMLLLK